MLVPRQRITGAVPGPAAADFGCRTSLCELSVLPSMEARSGAKQRKITVPGGRANDNDDDDDKDDAEEDHADDESAGGRSRCLVTSRRNELV